MRHGDAWWGAGVSRLSWRQNSCVAGFAKLILLKCLFEQPYSCNDPIHLQRILNSEISKIISGKQNNRTH